MSWAEFRLIVGSNKSNKIMALYENSDTSYTISSNLAYSDINVLAYRSVHKEVDEGYDQFKVILE